MIICPPLHARPRGQRILFATLAGLLATLVLNVLAYLAHEQGLMLLSKMLIWPNTLLQSFAPLHNIGSARRPVMEGTPLNILAFFASIPLAWLVYAGVAAAWSCAGKRRAGPDP